MNRGLHMFLDVGELNAHGDPGPQSSALAPGLTALLSFCKDHTITATVFINNGDGSLLPALHHHGYPEVRVVSEEHLWLPAADGLSMQECQTFAYANTECDRCPRCMRNVMLGNTGEGDVLIYVGDGHADPCPAEYADIVIAHGALQTWCQRHNITHIVYRSLEDVHRCLATMLERRKLRPSARAGRKRREAYRIEA